MTRLIAIIGSLSAMDNPSYVIDCEHDLGEFSIIWKTVSLPRWSLRSFTVATRITSQFFFKCCEKVKVQIEPISRVIYTIYNIWGICKHITWSRSNCPNKELSGGLLVYLIYIYNPFISVLPVPTKNLIAKLCQFTKLDENNLHTITT